mgnify:FL=1
MSNLHDSSSCPYATRIVTLETRQSALPTEFSQEWGKLKQQIFEIHETLKENGLEKRVRLLEQSRTYFLGLAGGIGVVASLLSPMVIQWFRG